MCLLLLLQPDIMLCLGAELTLAGQPSWPHTPAVMLLLPLSPRPERRGRGGV